MSALYASSPALRVRSDPPTWARSFLFVTSMAAIRRARPTTTSSSVTRSCCREDYSNVSWPGVSEGTIGYVRDHPGQLKPVAIGFNKVLFQKSVPDFDLNASFARTFPDVPKKTVEMCGQPTYLFLAGLVEFFDL